MKNKQSKFADLQIVELPIDTLRLPEYYNRCEIEGKKPFLEKSIEKYGLIEPLLVNTSNEREHVIIDGVARWEICKALGYETIQVLLTYVPKEEEIQHHIIANEQARKFYREFIEENITDDLADALLRCYSREEDSPGEDPLKDIQSTSDLKDELTKFSIAIFRSEADWFDSSKKTLGCKNRSQVIQFLIKNYKENESLKTA
jgi:hypothetical protein